MTFKTSISLTDSQKEFALKLVESGKFPSLSAVLQHGLENFRTEHERHEAEITALRSLLDERMRGKSISMAEGRKRTRRMIAEKKAALLGKAKA